MSSVQKGFLALGIIISFLTTILFGFLIYGNSIFLSHMSSTQIFMNAVAGSIFYYSLKYSNIKISGVFLIMIAVLFMLFHTHASNLNSFVRDILFYFALGAGIYLFQICTESIYLDFKDIVFDCYSCCLRDNSILWYSVYYLVSSSRNKS